MNKVTQILAQIESGDRSAADELLPLVYDELRRFAATKLAAERPGQTLQATALVHEAYIGLVGSGDQQSWQSRRHFFAAAARAMRNILVDKARRKSRAKHGGDLQRVDFEELQVVEHGSPDELIRTHDALKRLGTEDATAAEVIELCYFGGISIEQAAELLGISRATAYRHWAYARAWLCAEVRRGE